MSTLDTGTRRCSILELSANCCKPQKQKVKRNCLFFFRNWWKFRSQADSITGELLFLQRMIWTPACLGETSIFQYLRPMFSEAIYCLVVGSLALRRGCTFWFGALLELFGCKFRQCCCCCASLFVMLVNRQDLITVVVGPPHCQYFSPSQSQVSVNCLVLPSSPCFEVFEARNNCAWLDGLYRVRANRGCGLRCARSSGIRWGPIEFRPRMALFGLQSIRVHRN